LVVGGWLLVVGYWLLVYGFMRNPGNQEKVPPFVVTISIVVGYEKELKDKFTLDQLSR